MMFQIQSQGLQPLTTAHLAQTMTLLHMNAAELAQKIESELAQNPALELIEERRCPMCRRRLIDPGPCPVCSRPQNGPVQEPIVFVSARDDFIQGYRQSKYSSEIGDFLDEDVSAAAHDLPTYVMQQIAVEIDPEDREIAAHILTNLNEDGLLDLSIAELSRYHHVSTQRIETVLKLIQRADPIGVGSTSVQEALLVQLATLAENQVVPALAQQAISEGFTALMRHQYPKLARQLQVSEAEVKEIAQFIRANLNPYPARAYWGSVRQGKESSPAVYYHPDILFRLLNSRPDSPLVIEIISPIRGALRVNPLFQKLLREAPQEKMEKWKNDLEQATLLIKCIQQRNNTLQRMMLFLAILQRDFILKGDCFLCPITRAKVARELDVHESTISRAVSSKIVQLPNGRIVPLKLFFDRSLPIRATLRQIIKNEQQTLTDSQIAAQLARQGYHIARRTVAKYRAVEGILPAHLRRRLAK